MKDPSSSVSHDSAPGTAANDALRSMGVRIAKVDEIEDCIRVIRGSCPGSG